VPTIERQARSRRLDAWPEADCARARESAERCSLGPRRGEGVSSKTPILPCRRPERITDGSTRRGRQPCHRHSLPVRSGTPCPDFGRHPDGPYLRDARRAGSCSAPPGRPCPRLLRRAWSTVRQCVKPRLRNGNPGTGRREWNTGPTQKVVRENQSVCGGPWESRRSVGRQGRAQAPAGSCGSARRFAQ
jgi:hypothetical protein